MCMYITQYWKLNSLFTLLTERPRVSEELWTCVFLVLMFLVFLVCGFVRVCSAHHWSTGVFMPGGCVLPGGWLRLRTSHTCSWSGSSGELYRGVAESSSTWDHWVTLQVSESSPVRVCPRELCLTAAFVVSLQEDRGAEEDSTHGVCGNMGAESTSTDVWVRHDTGV